MELQLIITLADMLYKAIDGVKSNVRQCTLIGERGKRIMDELKVLDEATQNQLDRPVLKNLELGLTMGADLCSKFSKTSYIRQLAFHAKDKGKFDQVHRHLDTAVQDLTFVIQLDQSSWQESQTAWQQAQADDAQAALDIIEKGLLQGQVSIEKGLLQGQVNLQDSIQKGQVDLQGSVDDIKEDIKEMLRALSEQAESNTASSPRSLSDEGEPVLPASLCRVRYRPPSRLRCRRLRTWDVLCQVSDRLPFGRRNIQLLW